ncbi:hypothetical protein [Deinococcus indicus]|uniref:hypothetical protein n=1 Tax=Deinococcus indicus TaxID=223556 RepID=UPI001178A54C|nr:hypothetical protein [Deinococcus indicus]
MDKLNCRVGRQYQTCTPCSGTGWRTTIHSNGHPDRCGTAVHATRCPACHGRGMTSLLPAASLLPAVLQAYAPYRNGADPAPPPRDQRRPNTQGRPSERTNLN